jgi:MEMO1 family protein
VTRRGGVRPAAVAGSFYPASPTRLREQVDAMLAAASPTPRPAQLLGLVVPHAGYRYSGPVAATGYALLAGLRTAVRRVLLLGPAHFVRLRGVAVPSARAYATPLGEVAVDDALRAAALELPGAAVDDRAHASEHAFEVQLPFLHRVAPGATILPVAVAAPPALVVALLDAACEVDPLTVTVVSTDLSHYAAQASARQRDRRTADAVLAADAAAVADRDACGAAALRGLLTWAGRQDARIDELDLRTSGDVTGDLERVVGYGAFAAWGREQPGHVSAT